MYLFTTSSWKRTTMILFLLISLLLAACGGNSNGSGSTTQSPIKIGLISPHTGGDAVDAVPALRKLINIDQVELIIGPTSIEAQAVLPILQQSKIPDIIFGGTTQLDTLVSKYIWRAYPSDSELGVAMAR